MSIIDSIRQLAITGKISYTIHAINQMLVRNISSDVVERILSASDNQIIEAQSSSTMHGKEHKDARYLVYSPSNEDVVVVSLIVSRPSPEVRIVTAERVDDDIWDRRPGENPAITRKRT